MNSHIVYRFGDYRLDPTNRELLRGDEEVSLPPKPFDCIVYLVEHRDQAVGRDELIQAVWGHDNISDSLVGQTILTARRALDDTGDDPHIIKTVRGFGYRWVLPVESVEIPPPESSSTGRSPWRWFGLAVAAIVLLTLATVYLWRDTGPGELDVSTFRADEGDIALLLPVEVDDDSDGRNAWMRLGVMELINERLRAAGQPMVPSDNVISLMRGVSPEPTEEELENLSTVTGARLLLAAKAEPSGSRWRVTLRSLDSASPPITALGEGDDVLGAARTAADYVALSVGLTPPPEPDAEPGVALLVQQITAAMLANQYDVALELIEAAEPEMRSHPEIRFQRARLDYFGHRLEGAEAAFEALLAETPVEHDPIFRARILNSLGIVRFVQGDHDSAAKALLEESASLFAQENRGNNLGTVLANLAVMVSRRGELEAAAAYYARVRGLLEGSGNALELARMDNNLGTLEKARERWIEALAHFENAAERIAPLHSLGSELRYRTNIAMAHLNLLDPRAALEGVPRLSELLAQVEDPVIVLYANSVRAHVLSANGQIEAAEELLAEILSTKEVLDDLQIDPLEALLLDAQHAAREGDWAQAAQSAVEVVEPTSHDHDRASYAHLFGRAWWTLVRSELALDNLAAAIEAAQVMIGWATRSHSPAAKVYAALVQAELATAEGRPDDAQAAFEQALSLADTGQAPLRLLDVTEVYVSWLLTEGPDKTSDPERATMVFERIARFANRDFNTAVLQLRLYHATGAPSAWRAALTRAQNLAGERQIPEELLSPPNAYTSVDP